MSTILTSAIIQNATNSVNTYINSVTGLNDQLQDVINTLTSANFTGDASNGYKEFYTNKVVPAITENLTQQGTSLTASIITQLILVLFQKSVFKVPRLMYLIQLLTCLHLLMYKQKY